MQGSANQHDRVMAMCHMARCEDARQAEEAAGGSKRKRAARGFHNYLVSNLGLPEWVKEELAGLAAACKGWRNERNADLGRIGQW